MRRGDDSTNAGRPDKRADPRGFPDAAPPAPEVTYVFSREAIRKLDDLAVSEFGLPSIILMENAAIALAGGVAEFLDDDTASHPAALGATGGPGGPLPAHGDSAGAEPGHGGSGGGEGGAGGVGGAGGMGGGVLIIAGRGNNGGDGLAAARHLHNEGRRLAVVLAAPPESYAGDAAANLRVVQAMGIPIHIADAADPDRAVEAALAELDHHPAVVVDALLGTGLAGKIAGTYAALITAVNRLRDGGAAVVSADLPSGLDADTGDPLGDGPDPAVRADLTVTFVGIKEGFLTLGAQQFLGEIVVSPIGAPAELTRRLGRAVTTSEYPGDRPGEEAGRGRRRRPPPAPRTH